MRCLASSRHRCRAGRHSCVPFLAPTLLTLLLAAASISADDVYQDNPSFVAMAFDGQAPVPQVLWITREMQAEIRPILGHDLAKLRLVYWAKDGRSVWILDEIGKE